MPHLKLSVNLMAKGTFIDYINVKQVNNFSGFNFRYVLLMAGEGGGRGGGRWGGVQLCHWQESDHILDCKVFEC